MAKDNSFGEIKSVELKKMWPGEATHFTPWLAENLEVISDKLGMDLELIETEASAGGFYADIIAKDVSNNRNVIIENQFGTTDHKHLGQILTYASVLDASVVIWIAENIRDEHKTAIDFLNHNLKESFLFYAIEVSLIQIDNSKPAYIFNVISKPTDKNLIVSKKTEDVTEGQERYRVFFQSIIDKLRDTYKFTNAKAGQPQNWYTFGSENSKIFKYSIAFASKNRFRTEVYIDTGEKELNEQLFEFLYNYKTEIENRFGESLEWEKLENKRACRVAIYMTASIADDSQVLTQVEEQSIKYLLKMKEIFPKYIREWVEKNK